MEIVAYIVIALCLVAGGYGLIVLLDKDSGSDDKLTTEQVERMQRYAALNEVYQYLASALGREPTVAELWEATPPSLHADDTHGTLLPLE